MKKHSNNDNLEKKIDNKKTFPDDENHIYITLHGLYYLLN